MSQMDPEDEEEIQITELNNDKWKEVEHGIPVHENPTEFQSGLAFKLNDLQPNADYACSIVLKPYNSRQVLYFPHSDQLKTGKILEDQRIVFQNMRVSLTKVEDTKETITRTVQIDTPYNVFFSVKKFPNEEGKDSMVHDLKLATVVFKNPILSPYTDIQRVNDIESNKTLIAEWTEKNKKIEVMKAEELESVFHAIASSLVRARTAATSDKVHWENFIKNTRTHLSGKDLLMEEVFKQFPEEIMRMSHLVSNFHLVYEDVVSALDMIARRRKQCCSQEQFYHLPDLYCCYEEDTCTISRGNMYFKVVKSGDSTEVYCIKHYKMVHGKKNPRQVTKHVHEDFRCEDIFICQTCKRGAHIACCHADSSQDQNNFECGFCKEVVEKRPNKPVQTALKILGKTNIGRHMKLNLKKTLTKYGCYDTTSVVLLASGTSDGTVKQEKLHKWLKDNSCRVEYPFIYKHIGVFQRENKESADGETLVFDMIVHEYVTGPRKGTTVIVYLDTNDLHYSMRFSYKCFLAAYWKYAKDIGFVENVFYACAPAKRGSYLFYGHPLKQEYVNSETLYSWYDKTIENSFDYVGVHFKKQEFCIRETDELGDLLDNLCYEGGCVAIALEDRLKKKKKMMSKNEAKKEIKSTWTDFKAANYCISFKNTEEFVFCRSEKERANIIIDDPDNFYPSSIACDRDNWIEFQMKENLQFTTRRCAIYSTQVLIRELANTRVRITRNAPAKEVEQSNGKENEDEPMEVVRLIYWEDSDNESSPFTSHWYNFDIFTEFMIISLPSLHICGSR